MKTIQWYLLLGALFSYCTVYADTTLTCRKHGQPVGLGFQIQFITDANQATEATVSLNKSGVLTTLRCSPIEPDPSIHYSAQPILGCVEKNLSDGGYSVILTEEVSNGKKWAHLSEVYFTGSKEIARLACD